MAPDNLLPEGGLRHSSPGGWPPASLSRRVASGVILPKGGLRRPSPGGWPPASFSRKVASGFITPVPVTQFAAAARGLLRLDPTAVEKRA
ncbi:hypothetical protein GUJ93_ZPchr0001g30225 [Zizania palustris]|uniref:Uncharacterized protein n=1 Tax=Zizania palustris TaxID=103762 RepID=A0A8J5V7C8_ZIZPA|nr:hypothetical protein GUJ93_ZPchr0001g30225 [Zizania palustris]